MGGIYVGLTLMLTFNMVVGTGRFEVSILAFFNESGRMAGGECCSGSRDNDTCSPFCPTFFTICLHHHSSIIPEFPACTYGHAVTPVFNGSSDDTSATKNMFLIKIPFQFSWPETFSLVIDAWQDFHLNFSTEDLSRRILREVVTDRLSPPSSWVKKRARTTQVDLLFEYRVVCDEFYYSNSCAQICRHRNDNFGHYVCDETGSKVCLPGWQGEFCQEAVCTEQCNNSSHGYCTRPFECRCFLGWTGESCDQCITNPGCVHGFCHKPWQCICRSGWGGANCDIDLNFCSHHQPCKNNGTCSNDASKNFTCACSIEYTGQRCENEICYNSICQNGGKCQGTSESNAKCVCPDGFYGQHCQHKKRSCEDMKCVNAGTCVEDDYDAYCLCVEGFEGKFCESEIDECRSNPCKNGGTCSDDFNDFICHCTENYMGKTCGIIMDPCHGIACFNGGRCLITVDFQAECACPPRFTGRRCETRVSVCKDVQCRNGGSCVAKGGDYQCDCLNDYYGNHCEYSASVCMPNTCKNGGICKQYKNQTSCICPSEFVGERCESSVIDLEEDFSGSFSTNSCAYLHSCSIFTCILVLYNLLIPT